MAELVSYVSFTEDERRVLRDIACFVRPLGDAEAALINSAADGGEPMSYERVAKLAHAIDDAINEQRSHALNVAAFGHPGLIKAYEQNIDERLIPASDIVVKAVLLCEI